MTPDEFVNTLTEYITSDNIFKSVLFRMIYILEKLDYTPYEILLNIEEVTREYKKSRQ